MSYAKEVCDQLREECAKVDKKHAAIISLYASLKLKNTKAQEYAMHGFCKRIGTIRRCIKNIYSIHELERTAVLSHEEAVDIGINLQSFIFNVFGCLDNLAWIWVLEKNISNNGKQLTKFQIGLGPENKLVRKTFSESFQNFLCNDRMNKWFEYLEDYRHALAHRIPLYVAPSEVTPEDCETIRKLQEKQSELLKNGNIQEFMDIIKKINAVGKPCLLMTHSYKDKAKPVYYHGQVVNDWTTISAISDKFLEELNA